MKVFWSIFVQLKELWAENTAARNRGQAELGSCKNLYPFRDADCARLGRHSELSDEEEEEDEVDVESGSSESEVEDDSEPSSLSR